MKELKEKIREQKPTPFQPTSVEDGVNRWATYYSGKPSDCMRAQFLYTGNAIIEETNGTTHNVGPIFRHCEAFWKNAFQEVEIFITSPIYYVGKNSVAFQRTILYLTHQNCRISQSGITTLDFEENFLIKKWKNYYNFEEFTKKLDNCDLTKLFKDSLIKEEEEEEQTKEKNSKEEL